MIAGKTSKRVKDVLRLLLAVTLALTLSLPPGLLPYNRISVASAHNLDQQDTYVSFDQATLAMMSARAGQGLDLIQANDTIGIILKSTPGPGTDTGFGGYFTFYIPVGTQVVGAEYLRPDNSGGFVVSSMKGAAIAPIGSGPIANASTPSLVGLNLGPNINGVSEAVVGPTGIHRGTIAGVYADTGIFYSTDPRTTYNSWVTGGGYDGNTGTTDNTITNNRGETITPITRWDAEQLLAFGASSYTPILDPNGRGNAPWGLANAVAGPQSGYAWEFNRQVYQSTGNAKLAVSQVGPWKRIQYPGSQISKDQAGLVSSVLGYTGIDASSVGQALNASSPLPPTTSLTDATSPKAVRFSYGMLELGRPEYARVYLKITDNNLGCFKLYTDAFGGDAGGEEGGKDHLWRYYDPTIAVLNPCIGLQKISNRTFVKTGDTFEYKINFFNVSESQTLTHVNITELLPSGMTFVSAFPAQNSGPNPLTWSLPPMGPNSYWEATVRVTLGSVTGDIPNTAAVSTDQGGATATETIHAGPIAILNGSKSVTPSAVAPGDSVQYTLTIANDGTGPSSSPLVITEYLPAGFTYTGLVSGGQYINGGLLPAANLAVNAANPNRPVFTVSTSVIQPGKTLIIKFNATASSTAGAYDNYFSMNVSGKVLATPPQATVNVGDGKIGDTIYRDWNGNGIQDPGEEGLPYITVTLSGPSGTQTTTTDANGNYIFTGLTAGTYTVSAPAVGAGGVPSGYSLTGDPDSTLDGSHTITLSTGQQYLTADFGYKPGGTGSIGDTIWKDDGAGGGTAGDGVKNGGEAGIANVTVWLYEDTNGNGIVDAEDVMIAETTSDASGGYLFTGLATTDRNYIVRINQGDPDLAAAFSGSDPIANTTSLQYGVELTADTPSFLEADFGFQQLPPATIGDQVFKDNNNNGFYDVGDTVLANISVTLYQDTNGNGQLDSGDRTVASQDTNDLGVYSFTGLAAGSYIVDVNQNDPDLPGGLSPSRDTIVLTVASGDNRTDIDFPFVQLLTKSVDKATAVAGDTLNFTITPAYTRSDLLTNLRITDTVPAGTTYVTGSANAGGTYSNGLITWNIGSNTAASDATVVFCPTNTSIELTSDTWIREGDADNNWGAAITLEVASKFDDERAALFYAPVSLTSGSIVTKAEFKATVESGQNASRTASLRALTVNFTEGTGNNTACASAGNGAAWQGPNCTANGWSGGSFSSSVYGSDLGTISPATDETTYAVDITTLVSNWVNGSVTNNGLALIGVGSDTGTVSFHSSEATTAAKRPVLAISYLKPEVGSCSTLNTDGLSVWSPNNTQLQQNLFQGASNTFAGAANAFTVGTRPVSAMDGAGAPTRSELATISVDGGRVIQGSVYNKTSGTWTTSSLGTVSTSGGWAGAVEYEQLSGDAIFVYTDASNTLRYNTWNGTTFGTEATITAPSTAEPRHMRLAHKPGSDAMTLVVTDANFDDYVLSWDGSAWSNPLGGSTLLDASGTAADDLTGIQATYESLSGDAFVFYAKNNDPKVYYRISTAWGTEASLSAPSGVTGQPQWIVVASDPNSDKIALGVLTTNRTAWFALWNGSSWGTATIATTGAQSAAVQNLAVAFESLSGKAVAVYGEAKNVRYRTNTGSGWSAELNGPVLSNNTATLTLTPDPNSNEIMLSALDSGQDYYNNLWTGSAWGARTTQTTATGTATGQPFNYQWFQNELTQPGTRLALTASPTLAVNSGTVTLQAVIESASTITLNSLPVTISATGGAGATCGSPTPNTFPTTLTADTPQTYTWTCTVSAAVTPGGVTFSVLPTGSGSGASFTTATSNSVLVTPPLTFQATVNSPATVAQVLNTASIGDTSGKLPATASNTTTTDLPKGSIGDRVWYDTDGDGVQDAGETAGAPRVTILLYQDVDGDGEFDAGSDTMITATPTDANGNYLFSNLAPGKYIVEVCAQCVVNPTQPGVYNMVPTKGDFIAVEIPAGGGAMLEADFGFIEGALIEGHVFFDENYSSLMDDVESGLAAVTVSLRGPGPDGIIGTGDDVLAATKDTDASGRYYFTAPPGDYRVTFDTGDTAAYPDETTATSYTFTAVSGTEYSGLDFGVDYSGAIGDLIWHDLNSDGVQDAGEPGLAGVTVYLYDSSGATLLATTVTDATGAYNFPGLQDGTYQVRVEPTSVSGYTATHDLDGTGTPNVTQATVSGGLPNNDADFGYRNPVSVSLSGTLWEDTTANGTMEAGEPGIANTTVNLYAAGPDGVLGTADDALVGTTTTDTNGAYTFAGVAPNTSYRVEVDSSTLPSVAYQNIKDPDSTYPSGNNSAIVAVGSSNVTGQNFGYQVEYATLSGTICNFAAPANGDCNKAGDGTETGISGVTVQLTMPGSDGIFGTADDVTLPSVLTDSSGAYSFTNLLPGYYQITKVNPSGSIGIADIDGSSPDLVSVALATGGTVTNRDFELGPPTNAVLAAFLPQQINGQVWLTWQTAAETDLAGFNVYRASSPGGEKAQINDRLMALQAPGSLSGASYALLDTSVEIGQTYYYWIELLSGSGNTLIGPYLLTARSAIFLPVVVK